MKLKINRQKIGIKDFDNMVQGGIPKDSIIGISGPPGVGKSIFTLHYLLEAARKGQKCVYINLEEPMENIDKMINSFSFAKEFNKLISEKRIVIKCYNYSEYEKIYSDLFVKIIEDDDIKIIVIDSFNCFFSYVGKSESTKIHSEGNNRMMLHQAVSMLRKKGLTSILTLETGHERSDDFCSGIPYLVDGLIKLDFLELGTIERRIFIPKMRWTDQYKESRSYEIGIKGIEIIKEEE